MQGGNYASGTGAGAGSGYVEAERVRLSVNSPAMHVTVGSSHGPSGGPSKVEVGGEVVLEAAPGGSTTKLRPDDGGDGYSRGGGRGAMGGSNGDDGEDGSSGGAGGRGSGLDVGALGSEKFSLVPGAGGITHLGYGGCAGGVIVNGRKPSDTTGVGFGAGGAVYGDNNGYRSPECVLNEKI